MQFVTPNFQKPFTSDLTLFSSTHNRPPFTVTLFLICHSYLLVYKKWT